MAEAVGARSDAQRKRRRDARSAVTAAVAISLAALLSGCGAQQNYTVPMDLCGVPVDQDLIRPLLPPGDRISFSGSLFLTGGKPYVSCEYYVDGNSALSVRSERLADSPTALELATEYLRNTRTEAWTEPDRSLAGHSTKVYGVTSCAASASAKRDKKARSFSAEISAGRSGTPDAARPHLKQLMRAFLPKAAKARGC